LAYTGFTKYLGFEPNDSEYKVMGLASYGIPNLDINKIFGFKNGKPKRKVMAYVYNWRKSTHLFDLFGEPARDNNSQVTEFHENLAASAQLKLEQSALDFSLKALKKYKENSLVLSGGVALNVKMNMVLRDKLPLNKFFVQPVSSDAGLALGCVGYVYKYLTNRQPAKLDSLYLGPDISEYSLDFLKLNTKISVQNYDNISDCIDQVALYISRGAVIAWMQGRMEFGPRALGARSILADPRNEKNRDHVNSKIKFRELFRPFCPSMLKTDFQKYISTDSKYDISQSLPFMIEAFKVNDLAKLEIPAVVHVDNTIRPQVLDEDLPINFNNPYFLLLQKFKKITSIGVILNASLNRRGEPIASSPSEGLDILVNTDLDYLVIGKTIIEKIK
jgi:carbamoyltransferase